MSLFEHGLPAASKISRHGRYCWNRYVKRVRLEGNPVFVVACGHSGTSLMLAVLGAHSRLFAVPQETRCLHADEAFFREQARAFDRLAVAAGKPRWVEKTPSHIRHLDELFNWAPDARVILMLRDGRDVAASIKARTGNLEEAIGRWVNDNRAGKPYWDHPHVLVCKYEDLVTRFEPTVHRAVEFLGEEYEPGMKDYNSRPLRFYSEKVEKPTSAEGSNHNQYRNWQINQPLFDGRERWKDLSTEELELVERIGGPMLAECGYAGSVLQDGSR